jgi:MoxR-like ATPase
VDNFNDFVSTKTSILNEIGKAVVGKKDTIETILAAFLTNCHILFEDFPGLGKTLIAKSIAQTLGLKFKRIQFTPDLLPQDITGSFVYEKDEGKFRFREGPIFTQILLADEINRASPRTQSALLEAMQEHQVTVEGVSMQLPRPFLVIATQNPIEYEGTFPLPEAELDRFALKISANYPSFDEEHQILKVRKERKSDDIFLKPVINEKEFLSLQQKIEEVFIDESIEKYIVTIIQKTRDDNRISVGSSPRGSLNLFKISRAYAALQGRSYVIPDDVKRFVFEVLSHRIILDPNLWMRKDAHLEVINSILKSINTPVVEKTGL